MQPYVADFSHEKHKKKKPFQASIFKANRMKPSCFCTRSKRNLYHLVAEVNDTVDLQKQDSVHPVV